ncbi:MAG: glycoside hydrolase family 13 protein [Flavisolibacter sp.]|nr:glycoside hydrolase family 13 protein [Flavisolibacter sp.]
MRKSILFIVFVFVVSASFAQQPEVYPTHWWTGMKYNKIQLMIRDSGIGMHTKASVQYPGVSIQKVTRVDNKNYLFLDLNIAPAAKPGTFTINIPGHQSITYQLKARSSENGKSRIKGVTAEDFIYLIMPDRFSNGDLSNDRVPGMRDQSLNRDTIFERHGGDLKGIQNKLNYLVDLGVTALWLNPVIENDMPNRTEHGYAFTNHYRIDRRLGGEKAYHDLITDLHKRGMKIIQDAVYNHTGIEHFLFRDMPDSTWFHRWPKYTQTSYKDQPLFDPYASAIDKKIMSDGWFVTAMPDINQKNPLFANFLIQHAIWSTEEFGLDGWRIDTYAYNDLDFMNRCNKALIDEYPKLHLFGETWVHGVINQAFFTQNHFNIPFKSNLPAVTDFQTHLYGIIPALNENFGWTEGVNKLYNTLAQDFVYRDPMKHVNFLDNHDKTRFFSEVGEDFEKFKMGVGWLMTARGIPQMYYGTEILMKGVSNPDGWVRLDFPGGWTGDAANKFEMAGRTEREHEAFNYVRTLANFRKNSSALKTGKFAQYVPQDGLYTYFRFNSQETVMVVMNTSQKEQAVQLSRYEEHAKGFRIAKNIVTNAIIHLNEDPVIPPKSIWVMTLVK